MGTAPRSASRLARCRSMRSSIGSSACGASLPYFASMLNPSCASKTSFFIGWNDSRLTLCCRNSSSPFRPRSLAGSKMWAVEPRIVNFPASCVRNSASAMAAGCATTYNRPDGAAKPAGSTMGARSRAGGSSSAAPVKSMNTGPGADFDAIFRAFRLELVEPARKTTCESCRLSSSSGVMIAGSPSCSVSFR